MARRPAEISPHHQRSQDVERNRERHRGRHRERPTERHRERHNDRSAVGTCTKYTLFFENFIVFIVGGAMTGMGAYILVLKGKVVQDPIDFFLDPACDMCLAGCVMFVMGVFGALGALREIVCCLKTYYYMMSFILLVELGVAVLLFLCYYDSDVKTAVFPTDTFKNAIVKYRSDEDMKNLIDTLQENLECCGLTDDDKGFFDWNDNLYFNCSTANRSPERCSVPYSCCKTEEGDAINYQCGSNMFTINTDGSLAANPDNTPNIYTDGCVKALGDWIDRHALIVGGILLGVLLPQVFMCMLTRNLVEMINIQKSKW